MQGLGRNMVIFSGSFLLVRGGRGLGPARREGLFNGVFQFLPFVVTLVETTRACFAVDAHERWQDQGTDVGEGGGAFSRDAVVGQKCPELGEGVIEFGERVKFAGGRDELGTDLIGLDEDAFLARMEEAEGWMRAVAKHGAAAIVGSREGAARRALIF